MRIGGSDRRSRSCGVDPARLGTHRRGLEQAFRLNPHLQPGPHGEADFHQTQRAAAERKIVVIDVKSPCRQHLSPDLEQLGLGVRALASACCARPRRRGCCSLPLRFGQGTPIDLAVARQWQAGQDHAQAGQHVAGQRQRHVRAQLGRGRLGPDGGHHVGHQQLVPRLVLAQHRHRLAHQRVRLQHGLDLAQFDTKAIQLDLEIDAA